MFLYCPCKRYESFHFLVEDLILTGRYNLQIANSNTPLFLLCCHYCGFIYICTCCALLHGTHQSIGFLSHGCQVLTDGKIAALGNLEGLQQKFQCMLVKDVNGYLIILKLFSKNMHYNTCLDLFCVVRILWRFMHNAMQA